MYFRNLFAKANTRKTPRVHKTKKEQETAWEYKDTRLYTAVKQGTQRSLQRKSGRYCLRKTVTNFGTEGAKAFFLPTHYTLDSGRI